MGRDPAGPGSRGGNWLLDTVEDVRDYVADYAEVFGGIRVDGNTVVVSFTAGLDQHRRGLQSAVEHPELVRVELTRDAAAKLDADIRTIRSRLASDSRHPELSGRPGAIRLKAPFVELAADLHRDYGDALEITVGHKPFPPRQLPGRQPVPIPSSTVTIPGLELSVALDQRTVLAGEDATGRVIFVNRGTRQVHGMTGVLTGGVRREGDDYMAGNFAGAVTLQGCTLSLSPGDSRELDLIIGTASCLPDSSYVVPPGHYEVIAAVPFRQEHAPMPNTPPPVLVARGAWLTVEAA